MRSKRSVVAQGLSGEPEPLRLHLARAEARFTSAGELVLLQDRTRWDWSMIVEGIALIEQALELTRNRAEQSLLARRLLEWFGMVSSDSA